MITVDPRTLYVSIGGKQALKLEHHTRIGLDGTGNETGFGLEFEVGGNAIARCPRPVAVQLFDGTNFQWFRTAYRDLKTLPNGVTGFGEIAIASSRILFADTYARQDDHLVLSRYVTVEGDSPGFGFLTALEWQLPQWAMDDVWFVPGVWYGKNSHLPSYAIGALGTHAEEDYVVFREDRLPLPLIMHFEERGKMAFSMIHLAAGAQTVAADDEDPPLVDDGLGFGAFGIYDGGRTLAFWFPGTEGMRSYPPMWTLERGNSQAESRVNPFATKKATNVSRTWSYRYHPVRDSFQQHYLLRFDFAQTADYGAACDATWRRAYAEYSPAVVRADLGETERVCISLLRDMTLRDGDATGIPTWIDCFTGEPGRLQNTFGIGFVARNLEAAYFFLKYSINDGNDDSKKLGAEIIDFWVARSGSGLSHTEFDRISGEWVDAGTENGAEIVFLRDQSESRRSCLDAWCAERDRGTSRAEWLAWVCSYRDWLLENQNSDGSFYRAYRLDGTPASLSTFDCSHVIPFLLQLDRVTDTTSSRGAALRAAEYLWESVHSRREFFGGTLDNPNCYDKEASALALEAYLCLFEATGARQWLTAAETAARVCESWIFQWNIPMPSDDPHRFFPEGRTTVGYQLITTGFSAFDMYLTRHVGEFARLARYTNDHHYREVAEVLLHNTKCTIQLQEELGYARPGMQIEHWSMGRGRGYGLNSGWLPWVATSHLLSIEAARRDFPN